MTQAQKIMDYVEKYGHITPMEASRFLNIGSPRKRISELIRKGKLKFQGDHKVYIMKPDGTKVMRTHYHVFVKA